MSTYTSKARTNYVQLRDVDGFRSLVDAIGGEVVTDTSGDGEPSYGFIADDPSWDVYDEQTDDYDHHDITAFAQFLADGQVLTYIEVGSEAMRYITGIATAVRSDGETATINLDDIDQVAAGLVAPGGVVTRAAY